MLGRKEYAFRSGLGFVIPVSFMFYRFPLHGHMSHTRTGVIEYIKGFCLSLLFSFSISSLRNLFVLSLASGL